jgi:hypothetical protein
MNCNSSLLKTLFVKLPCGMRQKICDKMVAIIRQEAINLESDLQDFPTSSTKEEMQVWIPALKEMEDLITGTDREVSRKESDYARIRREIYHEIGYLKGQDSVYYKLTVEGALSLLNRLLK